MPLSPARRAAFEILRRVEEESAYASSLLANMDESLREDDRRLCQELVLGVLRRQLWLDCALEHFASRRIGSIDLPVKLALRLGLYQLRFLSRIPSSAAVNDSVNLVRAAGLKSAGSFANAVLRRATREPLYDPAASISDQVERLSVETSHPVWLLERWVRAFGFTEAAALAEANNDAAPVAFRLTAKSAAIDGEAQRIMNELSTAGVELRPSQISPASWRVIGPKSALMRGLTKAGLIYSQDEASQLVAHLLNAQPADRVLDLCAAPGGKATHIAALAPGATIIASEFYEHRARLLRELAAIQGGDSIQAVVADAMVDLPFAHSSFDRVLVDAPCSGTGTLRHNPEIRWRLDASDIAELSLKQKRILAQAAQMVRPGGRLLYSTCSLEREENEEVAEEFVREHGDFDQLRFANAAMINIHADLENATGAIRTWPHRHDVDGFFMVVFQRRV